MHEIKVGKNEDGQRLDRILIRLFPNAGKGFLFKMLRKKNIGITRAISIFPFPILGVSL